MDQEGPALVPGRSSDDESSLNKTSLSPEPPTPLPEAVLQGDEAGVNRLLAAGANPNEGEFLGETPLLLALMRKSRRIAASLMAKGADMKAVGKAGSASLM